MDCRILIIIAVTAIIQSLYGVGVLLFGTPLMLLLGLSFQEALVIVLPISCTISIIQIIRGRKHIQFEFVRRFLIYTIPATLTCLSIALIFNSKVNLNFVIGCYLLFFALSFYVEKIKAMLNLFMDRPKMYLTICGIIHGFTNLGGSLLSGYLVRTYKKKEEIRATIAFCYFLFVIVQIAVLFTVGTGIHAENFNFIYICVAVLVFLFTETFIFPGVSNNRFRDYFGYILFLISIFLILKSLKIVFK